MFYHLILIARYSNISIFEIFIFQKNVLLASNFRTKSHEFDDQEVSTKPEEVTDYSDNPVTS